MGEITASLEDTIVELAIQGLSAYAMKQLLPEDLGDVPDAYLVQVVVQRRAEIELGKAAANEVLGITHPLVDTVERLRRLCEYAEKISHKAVDNPKWSTEYRLTMEQIRKEVNDLRGGPAPDDLWAALLRRLIGGLGDDMGQGDADAAANYIEGAWSPIITPTV